MGHYQTIEIGDAIHFHSLHRDYGRAEFEFCPVFKKGYLWRLYITSGQQIPEIRCVLRLGKGFNTLQISDATPDQDAKNWINIWCKAHKTLCQRWYVPSGSRALTAITHFGNTVELRFT